VLEAVAFAAGILPALGVNLCAPICDVLMPQRRPMMVIQINS
jgi:hypothetical protein